jgi:hypothetical protein
MRIAGQILADEEASGQACDGRTETTLAIMHSRPHIADSAAKSPGATDASPCRSSFLSANNALQLSSADLDLFGHFLKHTSRALQPEPESRYAWRIGIPNFALSSSLIMHSVLAVSAVCICTDLISSFLGSTGTPGSSPVSPSQSDAEALSEMLHVAIAHHEHCLRVTTEAISGSAAALDPEIGIINAYLMVPYAMVSYRVQRWQSRLDHRLAGSSYTPDAKMGRQTQPSWISSIRAAHFAMVCLREVAQDTAAESEGSTPSFIDWRAADELQDGMYIHI